MAKYKKREVHMIDMSERLKIKIVPGTDEEDKLWEEALKDIEQKIERRMQSYEKNLKEMIIAARSETYIEVTEDDSAYFIRKYSEKFIGRNPDNIKNRIEQYKLYINEQDTND